MQTSEAECLEALREAAERLGKSPTKAEYEELGLTPASATIIRVIGRWNEAKEMAGLETAPSTGTRTKPKPDEVGLPDGTEWEDLSVDQRWHYRNVEWNTERTLQRLARLRSWLNDRKSTEGCAQCGATHCGVLDFHHTDPDEKEMAIGEMVTYGFGKEKLRNEISKCTVLCANCHRTEHNDNPDTETETGQGGVRAWLFEYKQTRGCRQCSETDPRCLVFHHGEHEKRATIADMVTDGRPDSEIQAEVERCIVLCSNCHRKEHFEPPRDDR